MKIKHIWSVLCRESVIDKDNNNISIHGVIEELSVSLAPVNGTGKLPEKLNIPMNYEIVSLWQKSKGVELARAEIEYLFIDSENKELLKNTQTMEIPKTSRRFRSRMKIVGMPISKGGDYQFQIKMKEEGTDTFHLVSELPLEVKITLEKPPIKPQAKN